MLSNIELEKVITTGGYLGAAQATLDEMLEYSAYPRGLRASDRQFPVARARDGGSADRD